MMIDAKLGALLRASTKLVSQLSEDLIVQSIIEEAAAVVDAESCAAILLDESVSEWYFYRASGPFGNDLQRIRFDRQLGIAASVLESGEAALVADAERDPRHYDGVDAQTGMQTRSLICVPLTQGDRVVGVIEAVNKRGGGWFTDTDLQLLTILANFAAAALQNARAFDRCRTDVEAFRLAGATPEIFLGRSPVINRLWNLVRRAARTDVTVLITGESGTGKEVVAQLLHREGARRDRPLVCVNCAALSENLLGSELFGHEKGAFTGATSQHRGRFELAHTGTLFLDEVGDMAPAVQAKLLRVLETQAFERLGGSQTIHTDARVIAATNRDLATAVREGAFRGDLYHRLNVVAIHVPPLRERVADIPEFARYFAAVLVRELRGTMLDFGPRAMRLLTRYHWPGNVRELRNVVERLCVLSEQPHIEAADLVRFFPNLAGAEATPAAAEAPSPDESLWEHEKRMIETALAANGWNISQTARALGIARHHLRYRIRKYDIKR